MLLQGAKLTSSLTTWGCSRKVIRVLTNLAHQCQRFNALLDPAAEGFGRGGIGATGAGGIDERGEIGV